MRTKSLIGILACLCLVLLVACNTSKGFGRDLESAGEGIQNSADRHGAK